MNVVLIGFMGVGKTSVGERLAERLGRPFVDTDGLIEEERGMTVREIFERCGEPSFRETEKAVVARAAKLRDGVIATGGGAVLDPENVARLREGGVLIHLTLSPEAICERVGGERTRPLLPGGCPGQAFEAFFNGREARYRACCDVTIDRNGIDVEETVDRIVKELNAECRVRNAGRTGRWQVDGGRS
jgi:shikimate kinase